MYGSSGEVSEGAPSDYKPLKLRVTAYRVHGPDAAPARSEAERHPEPFPQVRFGGRTRPAVPLGRRKVSAAGEAQDSGNGFPFPGLRSSPGGFVFLIQPSRSRANRVFPLRFPVEQRAAHFPELGNFFPDYPRLHAEAVRKAVRTVKILCSPVDQSGGRRSLVPGERPPAAAAGTAQGIGAPHSFFSRPMKILQSWAFTSGVR